MAEQKKKRVVKRPAVGRVINLNGHLPAEPGIFEAKGEDWSITLVWPHPIREKLIRAQCIIKGVLDEKAWFEAMAFECPQSWSGFNDQNGNPLEVAEYTIRQVYEQNDDVLFDVIGAIIVYFNEKKSVMMS